MEHTAASNELPLALEIVAKICSYFSLRELETTVCLISRQWNRAANYVKLSRMTYIERLPDEERQDIVVQFPSSRSLTSSDLLRGYETRRVVRMLKVTRYEPGHTGELPLLLSMEVVEQLMDDSNRLIESIRFMPAYELMSLSNSTGTVRKLLHGRGLFSNADVFLKVNASDANIEPVLESDYYKSSSATRSVEDFTTVHGPKDETKLTKEQTKNPALVKRAEYTPTFLCVKNINDTSTTVRLPSSNWIVDTYGSKVLLMDSSGRLRYPELYECVRVSHLSRAVTFKFIREIFFPFEPVEVRIYGDRLVAVFCVGNVGIWRGQSEGAAEHLISKRRISGGANDETRIFRIGKLMIIRSGSALDIVDSMTEDQDFDIHEIPLLEMLEAVLPGEESYHKVTEIQLLGNLLLVIVEEKYEADEVCQRQALYALKLKRFPSLEDFRSQEKWKDLVEVSDSCFCALTCTSSILIPPELAPGRNFLDTKVKATVITLADLSQTNISIGGTLDLNLFDVIDSETSCTSRVKINSN